MPRIIPNNKLKVGDVFRFNQAEEPFRHCVVKSENENGDFACERPYFYKTKIDGQISIVMGVEKFYLAQSDREFVVLVSSLELIEEKSEFGALKIVAEIP